MPVICLADAESIAVGTLKRSGADEVNALSVARALVAAEADGLKGHGLSRLPLYAAQVRSGKVNGTAKPTSERVRSGLILIDACFGFAYPAIDLARSELVDATKQCGVAAAAIRRSHHCGVAGHPVEYLALEGLVAILLANTPAAIAPWGGSIGLFGTNPMAFAAPLPDGPPIVIDLSLSKAARGNILVAKQNEEQIPKGWALDRDGNSTTDPDAALAGTMVPIAGAKGAALAMMVELLAAGLTGANFAAEASSFLDASGPPPGTGQLIIAFDPAAFGGTAIFRFLKLADFVRKQPGARVPGSRRAALRASAIETGITISDRLWRELNSDL